MSTIAELNMLMNYENRQRDRREALERQQARDNFSMFTRVAANKINTVSEMVTLSDSESDMDVLDDISEQIESTKTGVDYVDDYIDAKSQKVKLRKKTVIAKNKIDDRIVEINQQLGEGTTSGAKDLIDVLKKSYINTVDQLNQGEKNLLDERIENAENHFEFRLLKNQYDTDLETEGFQLPSYMNTADKEYFHEVIEPMVNVSDQSGNYVEGIRSLQRGFGDIRRERADYDSQLGKARARDAKEAEDALEKKQEIIRLKSFSELNTINNSVINKFAPLNDKDLPGSFDFYNSITKLGVHAMSKTGENLQAADLEGMLKGVDIALMKQLSDKRGWGRSSGKKGVYKTFGDVNYRSMYTDKGEPLSQYHTQGMETFIERNTNIDGNGLISYNKKYGDGSQIDEGITELINMRNKLIEMLGTPGLLVKSNQTGQNTSSKNYVSFGQKVKPKE